MSLSKEGKEKHKHLSKKDHYAHLDNTCIKCLFKSNGNVMNCGHEQLVIQYLFDGDTAKYERYKKYLPHSLCSTCRQVLQSQSKFVNRTLFIIEYVVHISILVFRTCRSLKEESYWCETLL